MILSKKRAAEIGVEVLQEYASEAIEKTRPQEVEGLYIGKYDEVFDSPKCPRCKEFLFETEPVYEEPIYRLNYDFDYCPYCGQRIEWPGILKDWLEFHDNGDCNFSWEEFKKQFMQEEQ